MRRHFVIIAMMLLLMSTAACSAVLDARIETGDARERDARATRSALQTENARLVAQLEATDTPESVARRVVDTPTAVAGSAVATSPPSERSPLGSLAYIQGGDLWVITVPDGEPRKLTGHSRALEPQWAPSGEWLAYRKDMALIVTDVAGRRTFEIPGADPVMRFAWSPNSDELAYLAGSGLLRLEVTSVDGGDPRRLVGPEQMNVIINVAWSPDGRWIAYDGMSAEGGIGFGIWRVSTEDGQVQPILEGHSSDDGQTLLAGWTSSGQQVLYWHNETSSASLLADGVPLYVTSVENGEPRLLADSVLTGKGFVVPGLPDRVAIVAGSGRETWINKTLYLAFEPAGVMRAGVVPPDLVVSWPAWSSDGLSIAFSGIDETGQAGEPGDAALALGMLMQRRIYLTDGRGAAHQLTKDPAYRDERPLWSSDGTNLLFVRMDAGRQVSLWLAPVEGGQPALVVDNLTPAPDPFGYYGQMLWHELYDWWQPRDEGSGVSLPWPGVTKITPTRDTPEPGAKGWATYRNEHFRVELRYPVGWAPVPEYGDEKSGERYAGDEGYFQIGAISGEGYAIEEATALHSGHRLRPYGTQPQIEVLSVDGQDARLILPSADQPADMETQAALVVRYPEPVTISGHIYFFFTLFADVDHIRSLAASLRLF